ncbi:MAG: DUF5074 domain-containing protein, partial [Muribaculaceae bacterium]|nr:DUF5074 domain-containing protein [Muribaculaceae bacterium]
VIKLEGEDMCPPSNAWEAWTPDPCCASNVTNRLYWCGGANSWFTNYRVFRYDIDNRRLEKILDFSQEEGDWHVYGCSLGIDPVKDELYASMFHKFVDPTYITRRFDADGNLIKEYPMISNYWFPSLPVFPNGNVPSESVEIKIDSVESFGNVYSIDGILIKNSVEFGKWEGIKPGIYLWKSLNKSRKVIVN